MQQTLADNGGLFLKQTMDDKFGDSVTTSWILTTLTVPSLNTKGIHSVTCQRLSSLYRTLILKATGPCKKFYTYLKNYVLSYPEGVLGVCGA
jgi:hypothetical protein